MKEKAHKFKQRILLVNRDFQLRYTGIAVLVGLLSTILTVALILLPLYVFEILRIPQFLPSPVLIMMILAAIFNIALVAFMGILVTHRIAGPMYSLVKHLRKIEEGQWHGQMKLRDEDELRYVVRNFNAMLESVNRQATSDYEKLLCIRSLLQQTITSGRHDDTIIDILGELEGLIHIQKSRLELEKK